MVSVWPMERDGFGWLKFNWFAVVVVVLALPPFCVVAYRDMQLERLFWSHMAAVVDPALTPVAVIWVLLNIKLTAFELELLKIKHLLPN